jgi:hypothetical protein
MSCWKHGKEYMSNYCSLKHDFTPWRYLWFCVTEINLSENVQRVLFNPRRGMFIKVAL